MAIALRGSASVPTGNPTTGFTVGIDAAVLADDVLFLVVTSRDSTGAGTLAVTDNDTGGNTWSKIGNSTDHKATLWYKRATSATANKTVTVANAVGSASGVLKAFSGASHATVPYGQIVVETNAAADETHAGFTPSGSDSMVCCSVHNYANDNAVTNLSFATLGATTATEKTSTGGSDCGAIFGHALQSGAPTGTGNLTWTQTDGTTYSITWTILPIVELATGLGSAALSGVAASLAFVLSLGAGSVALAGGSVGVGFQAPTTGDHLFTGAAPSVSVGGGNETTIPVPAGSLTSTGYVLDGIHFLGANTGVVTIAGQAPTLAYTAPLGVGTATLTGAAAPLAFASTLPAGTVTAAGLAAVASVNVNTPLDVGAVLSSGLAPSLNVGLALPVPAGTLATSGLASSLAFVLPATVGASTFTGLEPSISGALSVTVPVGTATFSGLAPSLSLVIPVGLGTVTATGQAPALLTGVRLTLDLGVATFSGQTPALLGSGGISPAAGALILSGQAPTAMVAYRLETGLGTAVLTGHAPTVTVTQYVSPGVGSVVLSGLAPDVSGAVTRALGLGQAVFSGQVPGLVTGKVELPAGAILLTGYAPATLFTSTPVDTIVVRARVDTITVTPSGLTITARAVTDTVMA